MSTQNNVRLAGGFTISRSSFLADNSGREPFYKAISGVALFHAFVLLLEKHRLDAPVLP